MIGFQIGQTDRSTGQSMRRCDRRALWNRCSNSMRVLIAARLHNHARFSRSPRTLLFKIGTNSYSHGSAHGANPGRPQHLVFVSHAHLVATKSLLAYFFGMESSGAIAPPTLSVSVEETLELASEFSDAG